VRGTTNPAPCCHLANDTDLLTPVLWAMAGDNKQIDLWPPTRLPELTQNLIRSSHGHSTTSLKISCKSVQPFSHNVAERETKKDRKKSPENNTPSPYRGRGNNTARSLTAAGLPVTKEPCGLTRTMACTRTDWLLDRGYMTSFAKYLQKMF